ALTTLRLAIRLGRMNDTPGAGESCGQSVVNAAPTIGRVTSVVRFFSGFVPFTAPFLAIRLAHLDNAHFADFSIVDAAPTDIGGTIPTRFLFGSVTLKPFRVGFRLGNLINLSVDANPAVAVRPCFL